MKYRKLKGFTLIELIVVVAVFGIILAATMAVFAPVSRIFKSTAEYSNAIGVVDNTRRVLEDNMRYADRMDVYISPNVDDSLSVAGSVTESDFIDDAVQALRHRFLMDSDSDSLWQRKSYVNDIVYVMKVDNPENFNNLSSSATPGGKISLWVYETNAAGVTSLSSSSKEWAVGEGNFEDYGFSLSFGITYDTEGKVVAGESRELIKSGVYNSLGGFVSPVNFILNLDIYRKDYNDRANPDTSAYSYFRTDADNVVTLSFSNMYSGSALTTESFKCIDHTGCRDASGNVVHIANCGTANIADVPTPVVRYSFHNADPAASNNDIYFVYTRPDLIK